LPKLPVAPGTEVARALERGGFVRVRQSGSHAIYRHPATKRRTAVPMHGGEDLPPGTLRGILAQAGLAVEEFRTLLKRRGHG